MILQNGEVSWAIFHHLNGVLEQSWNCHRIFRSYRFTASMTSLVIGYACSQNVPVRDLLFLSDLNESQSRVESQIINAVGLTLSHMLIYFIILSLHEIALLLREQTVKDMGTYKHSTKYTITSCLNHLKALDQSF